MKNKKLFDIIVKNIREDSGKIAANTLAAIRKDALSNSIKDVSKKQWKEVEKYVINQTQFKNSNHEL
jgi:lysozyme family protein